MSVALSESELQALHAYWRAANYLSVGQIYLLDNPLLNEPLTTAHIKPRLLGHWGTTPGLNFIYAHLNRVIRERDLNVIYVAGPGHGGPGLVANTYLEGTYSEVYPNVSRDEAGMRLLFKQFSFPGGIPSHVAPETPGSIHEGGELGYAVSHAYGAALDNPDLIVACVVGDGEAETGPLAAAWHSNKFLNPARDGAVLPILHLKRLQDRQSHDPLAHQPRGDREPVCRPRLRAALRGGLRPPGDAPAHGRNPGHGHDPDPRHPGGGPGRRQPHAAPLAHDRPAYTQGLDRPRRRWTGARPKAPGAPIKCPWPSSRPNRTT